MADTFQTIIQGEDRTLPLQIIRADGGSFDLTLATEITAKFTTEAPPILEVKMSEGNVAVTDAKAGKFTVSITDAESALLKYLDTKVAQDFSVVVDIGTERRIVNFTKGLRVLLEAV